MIRVEKTRVLCGDHKISYGNKSLDVDSKKETVNVPATGSLDVRQIGLLIEALKIAQKVASGELELCKE